MSEQEPIRDVTPAGKRDVVLTLPPQDFEVSPKLVDDLNAALAEACPEEVARLNELFMQAIERDSESQN